MSNAELHWLDVLCPTCHRGPGSSCRGVTRGNGYRAVATHAARRARASSGSVVGDPNDWTKVVELPPVQYTHDKRYVQHCATYANHKRGTISTVRIDCPECCTMATEARRGYRRPPSLWAPQGQCKLCRSPRPQGSRDWCSDTCGEMARAMVQQANWRPHLVALMGHACWQCGERWSPGRKVPPWQLENGQNMVVYPPAPAPITLQVDHVVPLWRLTATQRLQPRWWLPYNLQLLCTTCHRTKTASEAAERAAHRKEQP